MLGKFRLVLCTTEEKRISQISTEISHPDCNTARWCLAHLYWLRHFKQPAGLIPPLDSPTRRSGLRLQRATAACTRQTYADTWRSTEGTGPAKRPQPSVLCHRCFLRRESSWSPRPRLPAHTLGSGCRRGTLKGGAQCFARVWGSVRGGPSRWRCRWRTASSRQRGFRSG